MYVCRLLVRVLSSLQRIKLKTKCYQSLERLANKSSNARLGMAYCYQNTFLKIKISCNLPLHGEKYFLEEKSKIFGGDIKQNKQTKKRKHNNKTTSLLCSQTWNMKPPLPFSVAYICRFSRLVGCFQVLHQIKSNAVDLICLTRLP